MSLELRQSLKLTQQLVITQNIQQAIRLLQLNHLEMVAEIQQEMVENPTLEEIPGTSPDDSNVGEPLSSEMLGSESSHHDADEPTQGAAEKIDWERFLEGYESDRSKPTGPTGGYDELPPIEANLVGRTSLAEHLEWQFQMVCCTEAERAAGHVIIQNLDHRGYLVMSLEAIAEENGLDAESIEGALEIVQSLDPPGCASRDLRECLQIQAKLLFPEDPFFPLIIANHLENIEKRNYALIAKDVGIDVEDAVEYHRMIQKLEPIPGRQFTDGGNQYITPDLYVFKMGNEWQIIQNEDGLPKLRISPFYDRLLRQKTASRQDREYIKTKLQSAAFLIQSIHRRQRTIYRVMKCILDRQGDFFDSGVDHLKPMVLRDVADDIGVHESTVSRATTNKYVQCPQGIFELKYFFNAAIAKVGGGDVASESVKNRIRQLISHENGQEPLSDQELVELLKKEGFKVARRTVAKYRDEQGILPSSKRKKMF